MKMIKAVCPCTQFPMDEMNPLFRNKFNCVLYLFRYVNLHACKQIFKIIFFRVRDKSVKSILFYLN